MVRELHYDFSKMYYQDGRDRIPVHIKDFVYEVDDVGDEEELKRKYYYKALESAAYKTMCEYADFGY